MLCRKSLKRGYRSMKILVIGASGTIGSAVVKELKANHDIIYAGRSGSDVSVDITSIDSIKQMYKKWVKWMLLSAPQEVRILDR
ncbi:hypothetical protein SAMN06264849_103277 [Melghirimyces algeriensis]|uniref:NAD dependent epimerase/dehydratase family protein n=1 Tax=Melghirimyces algeriensis TaxID=910412 RepID=A0A521CCQ7_9BACL|nr:hypothetical protein SAMN06264849_103277 [Melghirimyces algeriensis]